MRHIAFQKWEATGNDFFFIDSDDQGVLVEELEVEQIRALCDRREGRGADGIVLFRYSSELSSMRIINSDGSPGDMCGNALRCLAQILNQHSGGVRHQVELPGRRVMVVAEENELASVYMGVPSPQGKAPLLQSISELNEEMGGPGHLLSFGNPHYVVPLPELPEDWETRGEKSQPIADRLLGTGGINCGFLVSEPKQGVYPLRVYERGAGATLSCGSGACAASAVLEQILGIEPPHRLSLAGGVLTISRDQGEFVLSGAARKEYEGVWEI
ncbi:MAG: diaminopimelate epimerase [Vulcanimicrobiota bacterium]